LLLTESAGVRENERGKIMQIFYDASGKEVARRLGFISKDDILAKFKELGIVIVKADAKGK
jgi:hypothetical protein